MTFARKHLMGALLVSGLLTYGLGACSSDSNTGPTGAGGSGGSSSGGTTSSGGSSSVSSSGGSQGGTTTSSGGQAGSSSSSKGGDASGGKTTEVTSSGGTTAGGSSGTQVSSSGGGTTISTAKGGAAGAGTTGTGGTAGGGSTGTVTGGKGGTGTGTSSAPGGAPGTGGTSSPGGSSGGCQKGGFKGSDLVIFGESFYDWQPPYIKQRMEENARKAGSLGASDSYRQYAVAGQNMSYIANTEYNNAVKAGKFTKVVMDGGGIDCMSSSCPSCPDTFKGMLDKLVTQGVDQLIYTRYPEPGNPPGSNASLKGNLDALMPKMETVCKGYTGLKCYWVDLRPLWPAEKDKYTSDGLHPTKTGGDVVGDAIWAEMVKQCMAQ